MQLTYTYLYPVLEFLLVCINIYHVFQLLSHWNQSKDDIWMFNILVLMLDTTVKVRLVLFIACFIRTGKEQSCCFSTRPIQLLPLIYPEQSLSDCLSLYVEYAVFYIAMRIA